MSKEERQTMINYETLISIDPQSSTAATVCEVEAHFWQPLDPSFSPKIWPKCKSIDTIASSHFT